MRQRSGGEKQIPHTAKMRRVRNDRGEGCIGRDGNGGQPEMAVPHYRLFVAEGFYGVEAGGASGWVQAGDQADDHSESNGAER